jgi:RNA polymerase sigma-70 factor (ECF subfamily)
MGLGSLRDRERIRGWLFRILTNLFISQRRARAIRPVEERLADNGPEFSLFERLHQPFLLWWSTPEQEFLDKLVREDLLRAIDSLPDVFRVVTVLADVQGLSYQEIAAALDVPVGTVRSRLARGRGLLQKALWQHATDAGVKSPVAEKEPNTP